MPDEAKYGKAGAGTIDDEEVERLRESLGKSSARVAELSGQIREARRQIEASEERIVQLEAEMTAAESSDRVYELRRDLVALQVRLDRIHSFLPIRLYDRFREMPPIGWIVRRRTRGYDAALRRTRGEE